MIKSAIISFGTATPPYQHAQDAQAELIAEGMKLGPAKKRLLKTVYKSTGIEHRYSVLPHYNTPEQKFEIFPEDENQPQPSTAVRMQIYKNNALDLALKAIQNNFSHLTDFDPQKITHLITVSCTGMYAPGLDIEIIQELGLNTQIKRTAINFMGCYGAFNALKVADAICKSDSDALVLIVSVELCTIHFQKSQNLDNIIANAIFADGAAAVLVTNQKNQTHKINKAFILADNYCELLPQTSEAMAWSIADIGFDIVLSSYVPEIIHSGIHKFTQNLLQKNNLNLNNIDYFAIHPGGTKILQACEKALNITAEDNKNSYDILKNYGNMSSATVLFVLKQIWDNVKSSDQGKNIFSCAFGPGLTIESMLFKTYYV